MDNECHANICVFVQNSPDPPILGVTTPPTFWGALKMGVEEGAR